MLGHEKFLPLILIAFHINFIILLAIQIFWFESLILIFQNQLWLYANRNKFQFCHSGATYKYCYLLNVSFSFKIERNLTVLLCLLRNPGLDNIFKSNNQIVYIIDWLKQKEFSILSTLHSYGFNYKSEQSFCRFGHYKLLKITWCFLLLVAFLAALLYYYWFLRNHGNLMHNNGNVFLPSTMIWNCKNCYFVRKINIYSRNHIRIFYEQFYIPNDSWKELGKKA